MISPPIADGLNEKQQQSVTLAEDINACLLYTSPSPRDVEESRIPASA